MIDYSDFKCEYISLSQIRGITEQFRDKQWPDNKLPIDIEWIIEHSLGLDIIPEKTLDTDAYLKSDLSGVVVDDKQYMDDMNRYANRLRFSFAHEVGHYILHRSVYEKFEVETEEDHISLYEKIPKSEYSSFEWQANEFAGSLLVPRQIIINEIEKIYEDIKEKDGLELLEKYPSDILSRYIEKLCKPFGVSSQVIERRVEVEKLWPPIPG